VVRTVDGLQIRLELYIPPVYTIFGRFPAKNNVHTPCMYI